MCIVDGLVDELEALNKSNKRELYSYLVIVIAHLLKWQYQSEYRCGSWRGSIQNGRRCIERLFKDQPSLRQYISEIISEAYYEGCELAEDETGLKNFPRYNIFEIDEIISLDFFPQTHDDC